ncbi:acyl-CoA N-acyltransferase [Phlyctochytrium arcticum]|nr:acyl-CoA N-acyltransferase [Phlyctochytrium arcticum]
MTAPLLPPSLHPHIRPATAADVPVLQTLINAAYRSTTGWTTENHLIAAPRCLSPDILLPLLSPPRDPATGIFLAYHVPEQPEPIGCINVKVEDGGMGYFGMFAVRPDVQGGGVGRKLVEAAMEILRSRGCTRCYIIVLKARTDIHAWYKRMGFEDKGKDVPFPVNSETPSLREGVEPSMVWLEREL